MAHHLDTPRQRARAAAVAVALAAAAGLHLAAFPQHLEEGAVVAAFFLGTAGAQLAAAVLVQRGVRRRGAVLIAAANLALVALWALSRTVALPGIGSGNAAEPATWLDMLAVAAEAIVVLGLLAPPARVRLAAAGVPWPATAAVSLVACAAALQWAPPSHTHGVRDSFPAVVEAVDAREPELPHKHGNHTHGTTR